MTVRDALNSAIDEEMARDKSVYILGEEVRESCTPAPHQTVRHQAALHLPPAPTQTRACLPPLGWYPSRSQVGEYQGAYKITRGLLQKYGGDRVRDTPITEVQCGAICWDGVYCIAAGAAVAADTVDALG